MDFYQAYSTEALDYGSEGQVQAAVIISFLFMCLSVPYIVCVILHILTALTHFVRHECLRFMGEKVKVQGRDGIKYLRMKVYST